MSFNFKEEFTAKLLRAYKNAKIGEEIAINNEGEVSIVTPSPLIYNRGVLISKELLFDMKKVHGRELNEKILDDFIDELYKNYKKLQSVGDDCALEFLFNHSKRVNRSLMNEAIKKTNKPCIGYDNVLNIIPIIEMSTPTSSINLNMEDNNGSINVVAKTYTTKHRVFYEDELNEEEYRDRIREVYRNLYELKSESIKYQLLSFHNFKKENQKPIQSYEMFNTLINAISDAAADNIKLNVAVFGHDVWRKFLSEYLKMPYRTGENLSLKTVAEDLEIDYVFVYKGREKALWNNISLVCLDRSETNFTGIKNSFAVQNEYVNDDMMFATDDTLATHLMCMFRGATTIVNKKNGFIYSLIQ